MADPMLDELYRRIVGSGAVYPMAHMRETMAAGVVKVAAGGGGGGGPEPMAAGHAGDPAAIMNAALMGAPFNVVQGPGQIYSQPPTPTGYPFGSNVTVIQPAATGMPRRTQPKAWPASPEVQVPRTSAIPPNLADSMQWVLDHIARQEAGPMIGLVGPQFPLEPGTLEDPTNQMPAKAVGGCGTIAGENVELRSANALVRGELEAGSSYQRMTLPSELISKIREHLSRNGLDPASEEGGAEALRVITWYLSSAEARRRVADPRRPSQILKPESAAHASVEAPGNNSNDPAATVGAAASDESPLTYVSVVRDGEPPIVYADDDEDRVEEAKRQGWFEKAMKGNPTGIDVFYGMTCKWAENYIDDIEEDVVCGHCVENEEPNCPDRGDNQNDGDEWISVSPPVYWCANSENPRDKCKGGSQKLIKPAIRTHIYRQDCYRHLGYKYVWDPDNFFVEEIVKPGKQCCNARKRTQKNREFKIPGCSNP